MKRTYIPFLACSIMAVAFAARLAMIYLRFDEPSGCGECLVAATAISDAPFLALWSATLWLGYNLRGLLVSSLCRLTAVVCLLFYVADVYVLYAFSTRLYVNWVITIGATPGFVFDHLKSSGLMDVLGLGILLVISIAVITFQPKPKKRKPRMLMYLAAIVVTTLVMGGLNRVQYVHAWVTENLFFTSQFSGISNPYSNEYLAPLADRFGDVPSCRSGLNKRSDVMVLILESWSANHSQLWGGEHNWTPSLDHIAKKSIRSSRFIAGGFNTNQGLAAIISATPVLASLTSVFTRKSFEPAWGSDFTLPRQLNGAGYQTAFLTSGDLSFLGKSNWLEQTGFEYIEDTSHPFYQGQPRGHFNAAPDGVLFDRAVDYWKKNHGQTEPLGVVVESVSSHTPFVHPITGESGEETVIRYMDAATGELFKKLDDEGFFNSGGVLMIVSDHRAMTMMRDEESRRFGSWAPALIPMLVYSETEAPFVTDSIYHQSDIAPSLSKLLTEEGCGYPGWRDLFQEPSTLLQKDVTPGQCVFHASGTNVENLIVFCDDGYGVIELNGDDSFFLEAENLSVVKQTEILQKVAYFRTTAQQLTTEYLKLQ